MASFLPAKHQSEHKYTIVVYAIVMTRECIYLHITSFHIGSVIFKPGRRVPAESQCSPDFLKMLVFVRVCMSLTSGIIWCPCVIEFYSLSFSF